MIEAVHIRRVQPDDWRVVRTIRLEMLADTPSAYLTTYAEAEAYPDSVWVERCEAGATGDGQATFLGVDQGEAVAMGVGLRRPGQRALRSKDVLVIVSVFVAAQYRGTGVAEELMAAIEQWGVSWGAPVASLGVTETNDRAAAFYGKIGYRPTGDRTSMGPDTELCEIVLDKPL